MDNISEAQNDFEIIQNVETNQIPPKSISQEPIFIDHQNTTNKYDSQHVEEDDV